MKTLLANIVAGQKFSLTEDGHTYLAVDDAEVSARYSEVNTTDGYVCQNPTTKVWA